MFVLGLLVAWSLAPRATDIARRGDVELRWTAPSPTCPDADAVIDDALALLGGGPLPPGSLRVSATVVEGDGFVLELRVGDDDALPRTLASPRCGELARAAALLTAMAIDPTVAARLPEPTPEPDPVPEPAPDPEPPLAIAPHPAAAPVPAPIPEPPAAVVAHARRRALHAGALIGVGVGALALPRATVDLEFALVLSIARARIELGASWWTPVRRASPANPAIGGRLTVAAAVARGCFVPRWRTLLLPLCGSAHVGVMSGRGTGALPEPLSARAPWIGIGGGPMLLWRPRRTAGRLGLWARAEGLGVLARPAFETAPSGLLWRARGGALVALAGAELRFWSRP